MPASCATCASRWGVDSLELWRWPTRALRAALACGVGEGRCLTFGDLLDGHEVGVRRALEAAALLELLLPGARGGVDARVRLMNAAIAASRWGRPGTPLFPRAVRRALAGEVLPRWLLEELGLAPGSTAVALDSSVWRRFDVLPGRVERFVLAW